MAAQKSFDFSKNRLKNPLKITKDSTLFTRDLLYIPKRDGIPLTRNLLYVPSKDGQPSVILLGHKSPLLNASLMPQNFITNKEVVAK